VLVTENGAKYSGKFISEGRELNGELTFSGADTKLYLHDPKFFFIEDEGYVNITGVLHDRTCVSLLQCLAGGTGQSWTEGQGSYHFSTVTPHYVLHGRSHLQPSDRTIKSIRFVLKDAALIFQDHHSFSTAHGITPEALKTLLKSSPFKTTARKKVGRYPSVIFFSGEYTVFSVRTALGRISAYHVYSHRGGGTKGIGLENAVFCEVTFDRPVAFMEARIKLTDILRFFQIVSGRVQELERFQVVCKARGQEPAELDVYQCRPPTRTGTSEEMPSASDLPVDAVARKKEFRDVLRNWLERNERWKPARSRFAASFSKENYFDIDRLTGAANMFDLLPEDAVPEHVTISPELEAARASSQTTFRALPDSPERNSVLGALGRLGHASLRTKINHRATPVIEAFGSELSDLRDVLAMAVEARNHFVHGTPTDIDYEAHFFETVAFFTRALEFVFVASDLLEAGWDGPAWLRSGAGQSHPLSHFVGNYWNYIRLLHDCLPDNHKIKRKWTKSKAQPSA